MIIEGLFRRPFARVRPFEVIPLPGRLFRAACSFDYCSRRVVGIIQGLIGINYRKHIGFPAIIARHILPLRYERVPTQIAPLAYGE